MTWKFARNRLVEIALVQRLCYLRALVVRTERSTEDGGSCGCRRASGWVRVQVWVVGDSNPQTPNEVITRLGIRDAHRAPWREGVDAAYERDKDRVVYVTPVIDGWVLVAGTSLFSAVGDKKQDEIRFPEYVASLSASLGTVVQYFATHRVSEAHYWILADGGRVVARLRDRRPAR